MMEEMRASTTRALQAYYIPLNLVTSFKYLDFIMTLSDDDWLAEVSNLQKASKIWARLSVILGIEGGKPRVSGRLFKAVVQAVILFGLDMWVTTPHIVRSLGGVSTKGVQIDYMEEAPEDSGSKFGVGNEGGMV